MLSMAYVLLYVSLSFHSYFIDTTDILYSNRRLLLDKADDVDLYDLDAYLYLAAKDHGSLSFDEAW